MRRIIIGIAALTALAVASLASAEAPYRWELVGGTGQTPLEYSQSPCICDVLFIFHFDEAAGEWLTWHAPASNWILQLFNDEFTMESTKGYWIACK